MEDDTLNDPAPADATPQDIDAFMETAFDEAEAGEKTEIQGSDVDDTATDDEPEIDLEGSDEPPKTDDADETLAADETGENQPIVAPQSMSAKDREAFAALPPEEKIEFAESWLSDRAKEQEAAFTKKTTDLADKSKGYDKLEQVLAPRRQQLALDGMDDSTAIGQLFALSDFANSDPLGFVKYMLNARQIPLTALTESGGDQPATDPQLAAMQQKMQGFETFLTNQQTQAQQQAENAINADVLKFAQENEFYAELEREMIPLVAALRQDDPNLSNPDALAKAYKMAIAANEGVSAKVEAAKAAKAETDKVAMAKARAAKAKKAVASNVTQSGTRPAGTPEAATVDDFVGDLYDERMTA